MDILLSPFLPVIVVTAALAVPATSIVWAVRAVFGLRSGLIAGRLTMLVLALIPAWLSVECTRAMNVPPVIVDDQMYDNDGSVRSLFFMNLAVIPSVIVALVLVWLSNRSFSRRLTGVSSAPPGAQT